MRDSTTRAVRSISVRKALADDVEQLLDLTAAVAAEGRYIGTEVGFDRAARRARVLTTLQAEDATSLVACDGDRIVGELALITRWPGLLQLSMMIASGWRAQGVGTTLLTHAIAWANGTDAHKIALDVFTHNTAALALYEKFGFEREGLLRAHVRRKSGEIFDVVPMGLQLRGERA